jgi:hypothetical protein
VKLFQARHLADLRRDTDEVATDQAQQFDRFQFRDRSRKRDDPKAVLGGQFVQRCELLTPVIDSPLDEFEESFPGITFGVLRLDVKFRCRPAVPPIDAAESPKESRVSRIVPRR